MKTESVSSRSSRRSAGLHSIITLVLFAFILLAINYLAFKHYVHKDLSQSQMYALSPKTIDVLNKLDSPVTIYTFLSPNGREQIDNLLKEYLLVGGKNIVLENIDPNYDFARAAALQKKLHFDGNDHVVIFEYKDKNHFVKQEDLFDTNPMTGQVGGFKGEQQFTSAILSLVEGKASKVYFTEGHGEHSLEDSQTANGYGFFAPLLKSENLETASLNLATQGDVPADADAVVIAGPSVSFSSIETQALDKYLANNGKLLVLLDPFVTLGLDDLLRKYGLKYDNDLVLYRGMTTTGGQVTVPTAFIYQGGFSSSHPITTKFAQDNLQWIIPGGVRSVTLINDEKGQPNPKTQFLLQTDQNAFGWVNKGGEMTADFKDRTFDKTSDVPGPVTVAAVYDAGTIIDPTSKASVPGTRVIVVGASKFLENDAVQNDAGGDPNGINFVTNCLDWLVKKDAVLDIEPKKPQEYGISLSPMQGNTVWWCSIVFIPGAAFAMGIFTWFSRRK